MTTQARLVLADCRDALAELHDGVSGAEWRRRWAATVALVRAVGHVLDKVDGVSAAAMRAAVDAEWATMRKQQLFDAFIERERNLILKQYQPQAGQGVNIHGVAIQVVDGDPMPSEPGWVEYTYIMMDGPYAGRDPRDVARDAIAWWEAYLDRIDARASRSTR